MAEIAPYTQQPKYSFNPLNPDFTGYDIDNMLALIREIAAKYPNIRESGPEAAATSLKNFFSKFKLDTGVMGRIGITDQEKAELEAAQENAIGLYAQKLIEQQGISREQATKMAETQWQRALDIVDAEPINVGALTTETTGPGGRTDIPTPIDEGGVFKGMEKDITVSRGTAESPGTQFYFSAKSLDEIKKIPKVDQPPGTDADIQKRLDDGFTWNASKGLWEREPTEKDKAKETLSPGMDTEGDTGSKPVPFVYTEPPKSPAVTQGTANAFTMGGLGGLDPAERRTQYAQVPLGEYTAGLPSMMPGGSIAPLEATYESMIPQLQNAFLLAQIMGDVPGDPNAIDDATDTYLFQNWLMTNPDIRGIFTKGLNAIESLRAKLNALPENQRQPEIDKLNPNEFALWSKYLAPSLNQDGTIRDPFAGAREERNLRQGLNTYLPEQLRYSANRSLHREFKRGMTGDPLNQYNLFQGTARPPGLGDGTTGFNTGVGSLGFDAMNPALETAPGANAELASVTTGDANKISATPSSFYGDPNLQADFSAGDEIDKLMLTDSLMTDQGAGVENFAQIGQQANIDQVKEAIPLAVDAKKTADAKKTTGTMPVPGPTGVDPSKLGVPTGVVAGPPATIPATSIPATSTSHVTGMQIDPTTFNVPEFRAEHYLAQGAPGAVAQAQANEAFAKFQAKQRDEQGLRPSYYAPPGSTKEIVGGYHNLPKGVRLKTWYDSEGNQQNMLVRT